MAEQLVTLPDGTELCAEAFGAEDDPVLLLLAGAASSMDYWDEEFCRRLADGGLCVIRYDHRDTGRSTSWPAGEPGYGAEALTADVPALLDALEVGRAHLAGVSMGGGIAQELAVTHPDRLLSIALFSTTASLPGGPPRDQLPPATDRVRTVFENPPPEPDWTDREAVTEYLLAAERAFAGDIPLDEPRLRATIGRVLDRARDIAAMQTNHWLLAGGGDTPSGTLADITLPTLVAHGTADPLFPPAHGEALAAAVPAAELLLIDGMGHQHPPPETWDVVVPAILQLTSTTRS